MKVKVNSGMGGHTGQGRWCRREEAKTSARKSRREQDKKAAKEAN